MMLMSYRHHFGYKIYGVNFETIRYHLYQTLIIFTDKRKIYGLCDGIHSVVLALFNDLTALHHGYLNSNVSGRGAVPFIVIYERLSVFRLLLTATE